MRLWTPPSPEDQIRAEMMTWARAYAAAFPLSGTHTASDEARMVAGAVETASNLADLAVLSLRNRWSA